jgi:hypothetical protein
LLFGGLDGEVEEESMQLNDLVLFFFNEFDAYDLSLMEQLGYARRQLISNDAQRLPITR